MAKTAKSPFAGIQVPTTLPGASGPGGRMSKRLKAWWKGEAYNDDRNGAADEQYLDVDDDFNDAEPEKLEPWGPTTLKTLETIWGEGSMGPDGNKLSRRILGWLAIKSKHTVLDLTAGMGNVARGTADTSNLWMDAFEIIPELVQRGQRISQSMGMSKRVPIKHMDLNNPDLPENRYDMIYSRERLFAVQDKTALIEACATALKDRGQILFTDYMLGARRNRETVMEAWGSHEREPPHLWSLGDYTKAFEAAGLAVINSQDISQDIVPHVVTTWNNVLFLVNEGRFTSRQTRPLIQECQLWLDRLNAIERGDLFIGRVHAQYIKRSVPV